MQGFTASTGPGSRAPTPGDDGDERFRAASRVTLWGAVVNVVLVFVKGVAGVVAHSPVMVADAVHSLSDLVSDVVTLLIMRVASQPPDEEHPYGHGRFETIGTVALATALLLVAAGIAHDAWQRFGITEEPGVLALWAAVLSIVVKEALYQWTVRVGRRHDSPLVVANAWHHRSDAVSSLAALAGIAGARMGFPILDPVAAVVVALLIGRMGVGLIREAVREFTDSALSADMLAELGAGISELSGVVALHELRARRMGPSLLLDVHVQVDGFTTVSDGHQVAERVRAFMFAKYPQMEDVLVHIDPEPDENVEPGRRLSRPREELDAEIRARAAEVDGVRAVTHVLCHYIDSSVAVLIHIDVAPELRVSEAADVARRLRALLETNPDIDHADIHLELDDHAHRERDDLLPKLEPSTQR